MSPLQNRIAATYRKRRKRALHHCHRAGGQSCAGVGNIKCQPLVRVCSRLRVESVKCACRRRRGVREEARGIKPGLIFFPRVHHAYSSANQPEAAMPPNVVQSVDECLKLWKRLRDRYTRELKAIEATKKSGSGYVSRRAWEFTESMAFYKHCGRQRKMTCSLEPASYGDDGEAGESIFATMENTPPSPSGVESPMDSPQELSMPATPPPLAKRPPETGKQEAAPKHKKGKNNDNFEEQLLCKLDSKMAENEAFWNIRWPQLKARTH
ncbi:hypothetical protein HPB51_010370 [Rhipicephalus microplus]|uniref:MADF domain-containing protein n=1 Tax=Rhipicephalus microplus TaxID=6941 RepID=A0A9J6DU09_RHIMP|nr:hypothetical protein HPB51_010370 [Rhipicephalus microplus]